MITCATCGKEFTSNKVCKSRTPKYCCRACANKNVSDETRKKQAAAKSGKPTWNKGVAMWDSRPHPRGTLGMTFIKPPVTDETKKRLSLSHTGIVYPEHSKENHWNWQGGITPVNEAARKSASYKAWRKSVFERDNYTCQICGKRGTEIHADHIIPFCADLEKRFDINNGRTLCVECHRKTDTYGINAGKMKNAQTLPQESATNN